MDAPVNGMMDVLPQTPFYVYISNFSRKDICLPIQMVIARTKAPLAVIHAKYAEP